MTITSSLLSQSLIENMSYVLIAVDTEGNINLWNRAAESALGYTSDEVLGQHANLVIPVSMQQAHGNCFSKALNIPKEFAVRKDTVLPFMHKSGAVVKIKGHLAFVSGEDGLTRGSAAIGSKVE